jgi:hypothetical protein
VNEDDLALHMSCSDCQTALREHAFYALRDVENPTSVSFIVCLACAVLAAGPTWPTSA